MKRLMLLIVVLACSLALAFAQDQQTAEQIIQRIAAEQNWQALIDYTNQVVAAARAKNEVIEQQKALIGKMEVDRQALLDALKSLGGRIEQQQQTTLAQFDVLAKNSEALKAQLETERLEREKLLTLVSNLNKKGWRGFLNTGAQGATVGAATGKSWQAGTVGLGIGLIIEGLTRLK